MSNLSSFCFFLLPDQSYWTSILSTELYAPYSTCNKTKPTIKMKRGKKSHNNADFHDLNLTGARLEKKIQPLPSPKIDEWESKLHLKVPLYTKSYICQ